MIVSRVSSRAIACFQVLQASLALPCSRIPAVGSPLGPSPRSRLSFAPEFAPSGKPHQGRLKWRRSISMNTKSAASAKILNPCVWIAPHCHSTTPTSNRLRASRSIHAFQQRQKGTNFVSVCLARESGSRPSQKSSRRRICPSALLEAGAHYHLLLRVLYSVAAFTQSGIYRFLLRSGG